MKVSDGAAQPDRRPSVSILHGPAGQSIPAFSGAGTHAFLALCVLMLATRAYVGIEQDAQLYMVQALEGLGGNTLSGDLYFAYGNQGNYQLFDKLFAPLVGVFGPGRAHALAWGLGLSLWLVALVALARTILGGTRLAYIAAAFVLVLHPGYGNLVLGYAESFVTPRLFAEAVALMAIAQCWRGRLIRSGVLLLATSVLHPLVGVATIALCVWIGAGNWRRVLTLYGAGILAVLLLAFADVAPFAWLFDRVDPAWKALAQAYDTIYYPLRWDPRLVFAAATLPVAVLGLVAVSGARRERWLAGGLMGLGLVLTLLSVAGTELLSNRLLGGLQFWRFLLFVTLFGNLLAAPVVLATGRYAHARELVAAAAILAALESVVRMAGAGSALAAGGAILSLVFEWKRGKPPLPWQRICALLPVGLGGLATVTTLGIGIASDTFNVQPGPAIVRALVIAAVMVALIRLPNLSRRPWAVAAGLAAATVAVILVLDERSPMRRFVESSAPIDPAVEATMRGRVVYWEANLPMQWFKLRMPGYYSCRQKGGINFFRDQAFEFERRAQALAGLNTEDFEPEPAGRCPVKADLSRRGPESAEEIAAACRAAPMLDLLVLEQRLDVPNRQDFVIGGTGKKESDNHLYSIYDCSNFRL